MNIIVLSEITLIDELAKKVKLASGSLMYFPLIKACGLKTDRKNILEKIKKVDVIVFQSKNSVKYSNEFWNYIANNKKVLCLAVGKFTADEVQKKIGVACKYPQNYYSSEALLEIPEMYAGEGKNVIIMKGKGGRDLIKEDLSKRGFNTDSFDVYERIKNFFDPKKINLAKKQLNYILVLSESSLNVFISSFKNEIYQYPLVFVAPQRILDSPLLKKIPPSKMVVVDKMDDAESYFAAIKEYQRSNTLL